MAFRKQDMGWAKAAHYVCVLISTFSAVAAIVSAAAGWHEIMSAAIVLAIAPTGIELPLSFCLVFDHYCTVRIPCKSGKEP